MNIQTFIRSHENDDERELVLKHKEIHGVPTALIAQQIAGRRKAKDKIPSYYHSDNVVYPPVINLEQCSSETTAIFKNQILKSLNIAHNNAIDLTGGFGIDSFFFSKYFESIIYVESNAELFSIAQHNHRSLGATNIRHENTTAEQFLENDYRVDLIYIDPSRRSQNNQRVFKLSDCTPDVINLREKILRTSPNLLIKASPLLDIKIGLQELGITKHVYVISVGNECKEVLFFCSPNAPAKPVITAVNITKKNTDTFTFTFEEEQQSTTLIDDPKRYLYEPNASILKAGAFKIVGQKFDVKKLQTSTHLYTSETLIEDFPGRIFEITEMLKADSKILQSKFINQQVNVITRNYPLSPEQIKSKFKLRDGGNDYLIAFSGMREKFLAKCSRLK
ncbi:class I SAM-dependent methyltransferase [Pseudochryseolinea flava]|uniref:Class I SAM-dependent methyltransferase n=1 Tax=Pseudochryseolinea flava TaxID=2059302 RepID=A0A364Y7L5_9BACT|nr:class I SAM-dependent methyltransferase [Pseudochryseolinea flava]RAW03106.1 class I SAM-dependent methyltransferase [Pseudochryseolinea flava]